MMKKYLLPIVFAAACFSISPIGAAEGLFRLAEGDEMNSALWDVVQAKFSLKGAESDIADYENNSAEGLKYNWVRFKQGCARFGAVSSMIVGSVIHIGNKGDSFSWKSVALEAGSFVSTSFLLFKSFRYSRELKQIRKDIDKDPLFIRLKSKRLIKEGQLIARQLRLAELNPTRPGQII